MQCKPFSNQNAIIRIFIKLGDDDDLTLFYDGRTGYVTSYIESDQMIIRPKTTPSDTFITFLQGGPVQLSG